MSPLRYLIEYIFNQGFIFVIFSYCEHDYEKEAVNCVSHDAEALFPILKTIRKEIVAAFFL